jgi:hypothetical protein
MSSIDSWWLTFWEWFATIGFLLVIVGCIIEGVEHFCKFKRGEAHRRKGIEKLGWLILVAGLAMEFLGDKRAKRIADRENIRLTNEAAQASEDASKANERAALATELAKSNELQVAVFSKQLIELAHQYDLSTNALGEANARLAAIKPPKQRLIEILKALDKTGAVMASLRVGQVNLAVTLDASMIREFEDFSKNPETAGFISIKKTGGNASLVGGSPFPMSEGVELTILPSLLK